jgi:hypothetical protein
MAWNQQLIEWHAAVAGDDDDDDHHHRHHHGKNSLARTGHRGSFIAANNVYDAEYIQHFTGIPAHYMPSYCDVGVVYTGPSSSSDRRVLLAMPQAVENVLLPLIEAAAHKSSSSAKFVHVRRLYPRFAARRFPHRLFVTFCAGIRTSSCATILPSCTCRIKCRSCPYWSSIAWAFP